MLKAQIWDQCFKRESTALILINKQHVFLGTQTKCL